MLVENVKLKKFQHVKAVDSEQARKIYLLDTPEVMADKIDPQISWAGLISVSVAESLFRESWKWGK